MPELGGVVRGIRERCPCRLLHHVTELAGENERHSAARTDLHRLVDVRCAAIVPTDRRFDEHDVATHGRVVHARRDADLVRLRGALGMNLRTAEELANLVRVDLAVVDHSGVTGRDPTRDLARDGADLALELTHAALAGVAWTRPT